MYSSNLLATIIIASISGTVAAILTPIITSWLHKRLWKNEKKLELKYQAYLDAVKTLYLFENDAMKGLDESDTSFKTKNIYINTETYFSLQDSLYKIRLFYKDETVKAWSNLLNLNIRESDTCKKYFEEKDHVISIMIKEIGF
jgi:hypothetical protein